VLEQWRQERPDLDVAPLGLFAALAHAYWLSAPRIERLMMSHGVARGMFDVLTTLRRSGPPYTLAPKQLARSLLLSGAGITSRLDRLEALQLIGRRPEPRDRRGLQIELTPAGLALVDKILPELIEMETRLSTGLSASQARQLTHLLDTLARSVQGARPVTH
jgi:DNA-binding MarR family transcriptional regulator